MQAMPDASSRGIRVSDSSVLRVGIVGCGSVSNAYAEIIDPLRHRGDVEVTMACDVITSPVLLDGSSKEDRVKRRWPEARFTTDYREVIADPHVDIVLVLTSMSEHYRVARAGLEAGKHVLVEKPMATSLEEGAALLDVARDAPGLLVVAPHIVLSPTYRTIWKRVRRGDVGKVVLARARYGHSGADLPPWFFGAGGGALFDLGVYNITALTGLLGPAKRVTAFAGTAVPDRSSRGESFVATAIDNAHVLIDFGGSVFASVTTGFTMQKYRTPAIEMLGDDWAPEGYELWRGDVGAWQLFDEEAPDWMWMEGFRHLVDCIRHEQRPVNTPEHAYHVLEIMLKAEASAMDGQARDIESAFPPIDLDPVGPRSSTFEHHDRRVQRDSS
jgi:predicted dehydrogenase